MARKKLKEAEKVQFQNVGIDQRGSRSTEEDRPEGAAIHVTTVICYDTQDV